MNDDEVFVEEDQARVGQLLPEDKAVRKAFLKRFVVLSLMILLVNVAIFFMGYERGWYAGYGAAEKSFEERFKGLINFSKVSEGWLPLGSPAYAFNVSFGNDTNSSVRLAT